MSCTFMDLPTEIHINILEFLCIPELICLMSVSKATSSMYKRIKICSIISDKINSYYNYKKKKSKGKSKIKKISDNFLFNEAASKWRIWTSERRIFIELKYLERFYECYQSSSYRVCHNIIKSSINSRILAANPFQQKCPHLEFTLINIRKFFFPSEVSQKYLSYINCRMCKSQCIGTIYVCVSCFDLTEFLEARHFRNNNCYCELCYSQEKFNMESGHFYHPFAKISDIPSKLRTSGDYVCACLHCGLSPIIRLGPVGTNGPSLPATIVSKYSLSDIRNKISHLHSEDVLGNHVEYIYFVKFSVNFYKISAISNSIIFLPEPCRELVHGEFLCAKKYLIPKSMGFKQFFINEMKSDDTILQTSQRSTVA